MFGDLILAFVFAYNNGDGDALIIQDADPSKPYEGTFTFNVNAELNAATPITINLPKANVVLAGNFATVDANQPIAFLAAKSLTIGDGTTATAITSDGTFGFVFSNGFDAGVGELTIAGGATLTTTNEIKFDKYTKKINVVGDFVGDMGFADNYSNFELNITGTPAIPGVVAANPAQINGSVHTIGNVNVALTDEGEAITGTLSM